MILTVLRLTRWELFKVRKRWMPWILLFVALAVVQATLWGFYAAYGNVGNEHASGYPGVPDARGRAAHIRITCDDILDGSAVAKAELVSEEWREEARKSVELRRERCPSIVEEVAKDRQRHRGHFTLPGGLANSIGVAHSIGVLLVMILGASAIGSEYGWGTLRTALTKGAGRWQFLGAKALSLAVLSIAALFFVSLSVAVSSLIAASFTLDDGGWLSESGQWSTVVVMLGKAVYGLMPYAILAMFLAVLTSSSSMGIAASFAYYFAETLVVQILGRQFDWFDRVTDFLIGPNTAAWMTETGVVTTEGGLFSVGDPPGTLHAFLMVTAYMVIAGVAALWLFQRRDVAGAWGE